MLEGNRSKCRQQHQKHGVGLPEYQEHGEGSGERDTASGSQREDDNPEGGQWCQAGGDPAGFSGSNF